MIDGEVQSVTEDYRINRLNVGISTTDPKCPVVSIYDFS